MGKKLPLLAQTGNFNQTCHPEPTTAPSLMATPKTLGRRSRRRMADEDDEDMIALEEVEPVAAAPKKRQRLRTATRADFHAKVLLGNTPLPFNVTEIQVDADQAAQWGFTSAELVAAVAVPVAGATIAAEGAAEADPTPKVVLYMKKDHAVGSIVLNWRTPTGVILGHMEKRPQMPALFDVSKAIPRAYRRRSSGWKPYSRSWQSVTSGQAWSDMCGCCRLRAATCAAATWPRAALRPSCRAECAMAALPYVAGLTAARQLGGRPPKSCRSESTSATFGPRVADVHVAWQLGRVPPRRRCHCPLRLATLGLRVASLRSDRQLSTEPPVRVARPQSWARVTGH